MNAEYEDAGGLETRIALQEELGDYPREWFSWLGDRLTLPQKAQILELAAGAGTFWTKNSRRIGAGWRATLTDISPAMVRETQAAVAELPAGRQFSFAVVDTQAIPSADATWDAVIAVGVFDYLDAGGRVAAFAEIRRALVPGGRLYTVTGGRGHLERLQEIMQPFVPDADYGGDPEAFGLENGEEQLAPWFGSIRLFRYDDTLTFAEPEQLLAYLLSETDVRRQLDAGQRKDLADRLACDLSQHGQIEVPLHKGLFVAERPA